VGSFAFNCRSKASAGGHEEQAWLVNNSTTTGRANAAPPEHKTG
jgi:hypothetical protein